MMSKQDEANLEKDKMDKEFVDTANKEIIHVEDGSLIQNFEVEFEEEEELVMAGGIKGLRALRVQRDLIQKQIATEEVEEPSEMVAGEDRFAKYTP